MMVDTFNFGVVDLLTTGFEDAWVLHLRPETFHLENAWQEPFLTATNIGTGKNRKVASGP